MTMATPDKHKGPPSPPAAPKAPPLKHYEEFVGLGAVCGVLLGAVKGPEAMLVGMGVGAMALAGFCFLVARKDT